MKNWRIMLIALLAVALVNSAGCNPFAGEVEDEINQQSVEVVRDNLIVSVSGSGRIDVSNEAKMSFGTAGLVEDINVEEGDQVNEGDVLARLNTGTLELALSQAEAALETAEYNLEKAENPYTYQEINNAQIAVFEAEYYLAYAQQRLAEAMAAGDDAAILTWKAEVASARTNLAMAEERLDMMLCACDQEEINLMEMQVSVAEQAVDEAQRQLELATLTAPLDGVIAGVYIKEGDTVTPGIVVIHIVDTTVMELKAEVDEIDVTGVKVGQEAIISVDAIPDFEIEGNVSNISLVSIEVSGVVSYEVTISFSVPEDSELRVGMSAAADIIIHQREDVLLVPDGAIEQDDEGNHYVMVKLGEEIEQRIIVVGVSDGYRTEVIDGLNEGDIVVIENEPREQQTFDFF